MRDFVGYGNTLPKVRWPGGAKIAISVVVNYEEGSEYSLLDGDQAHEVNNEVPSPVPPTQRVDFYLVLEPGGYVKRLKLWVEISPIAGLKLERPLWR